MKDIITSIVTKHAKKKMVQARKGEIALPVITGIALGDGAVSPEGNLIELTEEDTQLRNELVRCPYARCEKITDTCYRYRVELTAEELAGKKINEAALYDSDGDLLAIRIFSNKEKDADMELAFEYEDKF